ncbi:MAG TPA: hypothetical protein VJ953_01730 [Saprospiraceae bacterium]|nr:hypothetical protein [Saprospiraceae bacterium]
MDQSSLQPHYLTELRNSGIFTEGDLLELEDHFFNVYEAEIDRRKTTSLALQRAEQALGKREEIIAAFAQKRRWAWAKDLGSFFVFGLAVNLLGLWLLGIAIIHLSTFLVYFTGLGDSAGILLPIITSGFQLFITLVFWRFVKHLAVWQEKLPNLLAKIKWKQIYLFLLAPLAIVVMFRLAENIIPQVKQFLWVMAGVKNSGSIWINYFSLSMTLLTLFFGWQSYQSHKKAERSKMRWSLRLCFFFMAGCLLPFQFILLYLIAQIEFSDIATMNYWFETFNYLYTITFTLLPILFFPFAYRYIWQRKQYLA